MTRRPSKLPLGALLLGVTGAAVVTLGACGGDSDPPPASPMLPAAYPSDWNVAFKPAKTLAQDYDFGRKTTTLVKGTTFPPAEMPLPCDLVWERDIPVKLRDGVTIYTDVIRPAIPSTDLPAIISWSPYGKKIPTPPPTIVPRANFTGLAKFEGADAGFFACKGYAIVNPDARGAFASEGSIHFWGSVDGNDGYDVVEWVAAQSWSNGKVATYGSSWLAISQWFIAAAKPPHLAAIVPWNGFSDVYRDHIALGGIPDPAFSAVAETGLTGKGQSERIATMIQQAPLMNAYWEDKSAKLEQVTVPAYVVADGVTSLHPTGTLEGFRRIASADKWLRINNTNEWYDQYLPANESDLLRFFDKYLKGANNGWETTPRVRVSVIDAGGTDLENKPFSAWPIPQTQYRKLYLDGANAGLSSTAPAAGSTVSYDAKTGQTTFTHTFAQDTQIIGYLKLRLFVEAQGADDMDVFTLVEKLDAADNLLVPHANYAAGYFPLVPPPGAHGRQRVSLRELGPQSTDYFPIHSFRASQKLAAGQVVPVDIAIQPRAYFFHAGQKLRLTVAGYSIKYTTAGMSVATLNQGTHVIHTGGNTSSFLQIPVVP